MAPLSASAVSDVSTIAEFLACSQVTSLENCTAVDVLVLCVSAILPTAERVFSALEARPEVAKTLVLCGGIGHSTPFLYDVVGRSKYARLADQIQGLSEARVMELILKSFYPRLNELITSGSINLVVEDKSTNCGANALETRKLLDQASISSRSFIVVQDPTMSLRTLASFSKTYADVLSPPSFLSFPTFIPVMALKKSEANSDIHSLEFVVPEINSLDLWEQDRFLDLILGEIPRLRDDANGYGPKGKGFISHVHINERIEAAWARLRALCESKR